jgi:transmembrane sensor
MTNRAHQDCIEEEASLWAARLRGRGMSDQDHAALEAWLDADPEHRHVLGRYRDLSGQLDAKLGPVLESITVVQAGARRRRWRMVGKALAAAAGLAIAITVWSHRSQDFATKTAERHGATLADGSHIELNAQTSLAIDFRSGERHVRLTHGEALFSVAKDPARPFVVETPAGVVRVTGTVFNVRATHDERVEVTVLEGTVRLRATSPAVADEAVTPGHQATMSSDRIALRTLPGDAAQDVAAWRLGQAIFNDTPLAEVVERFAAYQTRTVTVDPAAAELQLGGRYSLDDLDGLLRTIERLLPVRVLRGADGAVRIVADERRAK